MMMVKHVLLAFALGYILCVIAKKQEGVLKTLGYTLGVSIFVLTFIYSLMVSQMCCPLMGKMGCMPTKHCPTMKR